MRQQTMGCSAYTSTTVGKQQKGSLSSFGSRGLSSLGTPTVGYNLISTAVQALTSTHIKTPPCYRSGADRYLHHDSFSSVSHQHLSKFFPKEILSAKHHGQKPPCAVTVLSQTVEAWHALHYHSKTASEQPLHGDPPCMPHTLFFLNDDNISHSIIFIYQECCNLSQSWTNCPNVWVWTGLDSLDK
jgi:hypothetical protein